jgi:hypothetical protein
MGPFDWTSVALCSENKQRFCFSSAPVAFRMRMRNTELRLLLRLSQSIGNRERGTLAVRVHRMARRNQALRRFKGMSQARGAPRRNAQQSL